MNPKLQAFVYDENCFYRNGEGMTIPYFCTITMLTAGKLAK
jgi:hypothetical protein